MSEQQPGQNSWYCKTIIEDNANRKCPHCATRRSVEVLFDHHVKPCLHCGIDLVEWSFTTASEFIYIIDIQRAPPIIKLLIDYLAKFPEIDASRELGTLLEFLGPPMTNPE